MLWRMVFSKEQQTGPTGPLRLERQMCGTMRPCSSQAGRCPSCPVQDTVAVPEYGQTGGFDTFRPIMGVLNGARAEILTVVVE